jgi:ERCC4-type nuclease
MILVDHRVGSAEIRPLISRPSVLCTLDYADFAFAGNGPDGPVKVGVERKGIDDLVQSMTTGRLSGHQLIGLQNEYDWIYLLVEGVWRPDRKTGVVMKPSGRGWRALSHGSRRYMAREIWGFLHSLSIICGIQVIQTSNQWETGRWLDVAFGWWDRAWGAHKSHLQFVQSKTYASLTKPNLTTRVASQFDGIGWDKARKLGSTFTLREFMNADEDDLRGIEGIGPKLSQTIIEQREK